MESPNLSNGPFPIEDVALFLYVLCLCVFSLALTLSLIKHAFLSIHSTFHGDFIYAASTGDLCIFLGTARLAWKDVYGTAHIASFHSGCDAFIYCIRCVLEVVRSFYGHFTVHQCLFLKLHHECNVL